jgi:hypothetical protein
MSREQMGKQTAGKTRRFCFGASAFAAKAFVGVFARY